ncbi:ABC transporter ATP-binding protein [candidate division WOR-3 bacterium]|nr:ABC transporter ATP-binding protein [candidate division WOR-3 bacterium]
MSKILKAQDIYKIYKEDEKETEILKELNLEIKKGEIVVILGPSGSGKTTLIHILGGLDKPTKGKVLLDGVDLFAHSDLELSRIRNQEIGFVFQFHQLLPEFTALENVKLPVLIGEDSSLSLRMTREKRCIELLEEVGLKGKEARLPSMLSGGERQRVGVARALVNEPKIVLADEPSGNLDSKTSGDLHQLFLNLNKSQGVTFIIATHKESLCKIASKVFELKDGKLNKIVNCKMKNEK